MAAVYNAQPAAASMSASVARPRPMSILTTPPPGLSMPPSNSASSSTQASPALPRKSSVAPPPALSAPPPLKTVAPPPSLAVPSMSASLAKPPALISPVVKPAAPLAQVVHSAPVVKFAAPLSRSPLPQHTPQRGKSAKRLQLSSVVSSLGPAPSPEDTEAYKTYMARRYELEKRESRNQLRANYPLGNSATSINSSTDSVEIHMPAPATATSASTPVASAKPAPAAELPYWLVPSAQPVVTQTPIQESPSLGLPPPDFLPPPPDVPPPLPPTEPEHLDVPGPASAPLASDLPEIPAEPLPQVPASSGVHREPWHIDENTLEWKETLQQDDTGTLYRAYLENDELLVKELPPLSPESRAKADADVRCLAGLYDPHAAKVRGICQRNGALCVVTDFLPQGNLNDILHVYAAELSWETITDILRDVADGLAFLHTSGYVLPSFKVEDLFVNQEWDTIIAELGIGSSPPPDPAGTSAPEVLKGALADQRSNVFSFGCIALRLLSRFSLPPRKLETGYLFNDAQLSCGAECPASLHTVLVECVRADPSARPPATVLLRQLNQIAEAARNGLLSTVTVAPFVASSTSVYSAARTDTNPIHAEPLPPLPPQRRESLIENPVSPKEPAAAHVAAPSPVASSSQQSTISTTSARATSSAAQLDSATASEQPSQVSVVSARPPSGPSPHSPRTESPRVEPAIVSPGRGPALSMSKKQLKEMEREEKDRRYKEEREEKERKAREEREEKERKLREDREERERKAREEREEKERKIQGERAEKERKKREKEVYKHLKRAKKEEDKLRKRASTVSGPSTAPTSQPTSARPTSVLDEDDLPPPAAGGGPPGLALLAKLSESQYQYKPPPLESPKEETHDKKKDKKKPRPKTTSGELLGMESERRRTSEELHREVSPRNLTASGKVSHVPPAQLSAERRRTSEELHREVSPRNLTASGKLRASAKIVDPPAIEERRRTSEELHREVSPRGPTETRVSTLPSAAPTSTSPAFIDSSIHNASAADTTPPQSEPLTKDGKKKDKKEKDEKKPKKEKKSKKEKKQKRSAEQKQADKERKAREKEEKKAREAAEKRERKERRKSEAGLKKGKKSDEVDDLRRRLSTIDKSNHF